MGCHDAGWRLAAQRGCHHGCVEKAAAEAEAEAEAAVAEAAAEAVAVGDWIAEDAASKFMHATEFFCS